MIARILVAFLFALIQLVPVVAQPAHFEFGGWKHTSLHGVLSLQQLYRSQQTILRSGVTEKPVMQDFNGQIQLDSRSYIWHPNFMQVNVNLDYHPSIRNEKFLVIPNRSETRTAEKFRVETLLFDQRPLSLNMFSGVSHSYINREYASSIENTRQDYGGGISFRNSMLPVSIRYLNSDWEQHELATARIYTNKRENIHGDVRKSFGNLDDSKLSYNYDDYQREYGNAGGVHNYTSQVQLTNRLVFNEQRRNLWNSMINYRKQNGSQPFERIQINENPQFYLPAKFKTQAIYRFNDYKQQVFKNRLQSILGRLEHQLFLSLQSQIYYEYTDIHHSSYQEYTNRWGFGLNYQKRIPIGLLKLGYNLQRRNDNHDSNPGIQHIIAEEHELLDQQTTLLNQPDADRATIVVWDEDRSIRYQENIDYVVLQRDPYLEIQRLPGGQIDNGQTVMVDYQALQLNSYQFDTNTQTVRASLLLFNRFLECYIQTQDQSYTNVNASALRILKTISQHVYGIRLQWKEITAGWELDNYSSNVVPYISSRYFMALSHDISSSFNTYISGNWRDYELTDENETQQFADVSGRLVYAWTRSTSLSLDGGYRFQDGRGIDLKLTNLRFQLTSQFRELYLTVGLDVYRRDYSGETLDYNGGFIRVERKF
ncbi:hypothetical protein JXJ21_02445 [candidate division KSB1 bacterium]|nr:hypothetical protein [candidate division KSB1 bacterium]